MKEILVKIFFLPRVAASVRNIPVLAGEGVTLLYKMALEYIINFFGLLQFQHFFSSFYAFQESTNDPRHTQFTESMCEDPVKEKQL